MPQETHTDPTDQCARHDRRKLPGVAVAHLQLMRAFSTTKSSQLLEEQPPSSSETCGRLLTGLRTARDPAVRSGAAAALREFIEGEAGELQGDEASAFFAELHQGVENMLASRNPEERAGGVVAVATLLQADTDEQGLRLSGYAAVLQLALQNSAIDPEMLQTVCDAFGQLCRSGRDPEVVEREAKRALDRLAEEQKRETKKKELKDRAEIDLQMLAATLSLRELATHAPVAMYIHVPSVFELLWSPLTAPSLQLRLSAGDTETYLELMTTDRPDDC